MKEKKKIEKYKPTNEIKTLITAIRNDYRELLELKKKHCGCWCCQVGEFVSVEKQNQLSPHKTTTTR